MGKVSRTTVDGLAWFSLVHLSKHHGDLEAYFNAEGAKLLAEYHSSDLVHVHKRILVSSKEEVSLHMVYTWMYSWKF